MRLLLCIMGLLLLSSLALGQDDWRYNGQEVGVDRDELIELFRCQVSSLLGRIELKATNAEPTQGFLKRLDSMILVSEDIIFKITFRYRDDNELSSAQIFTRSDPISDWKLSFERKYKYDALGRRVETVIYEPWDTWDPVLVFRIEYEWSVYGLVSESNFMWDEGTRTWNPYSEIKIEYDTASGNEAVRIERNSWLEEEERWGYQNRIESLYGREGLLVEQVEYYWNRDTNDWILLRIGEYSYDQHDRLIREQSFSFPDSIKREMERIDYIRNKNGDLVQYLNHRFYSPLIGLLPHYKEQYEYDNDRALTVLTDFTWDRKAELWEPHSRDVYEYDKRHNAEDLLFPNCNWFPPGGWTYDFTFRFMPIRTESLSFDEYRNAWDLSSRISYHYSDYVVGVMDCEIVPLKVYPNPSDGTIGIEWGHGARIPPDIEIYDVYGRFVASVKWDSNGKIDLGFLQKGAYFLKSRIGNIIYQSTVVLN